jgi:hypothetical protein
MHDETFMHVFSCCAKPARLQHDTEKLSLCEVLNKSYALQEIQDHIFSGLHQWESGTPTIKSSLTNPSLNRLKLAGKTLLKAASLGHGGLLLSF